MAHAAVNLERLGFKLYHVLYVLQSSFMELSKEQILVRGWQTLDSKYFKLLS